MKHAPAQVPARRGRHAAVDDATTAFAPLRLPAQRTSSTEATQRLGRHAVDGHTTVLPATRRTVPSPRPRPVPPAAPPVQDEPTTVLPVRDEPTTALPAVLRRTVIRQAPASPPRHRVAYPHRAEALPMMVRPAAPAEAPTVVTAGGIGVAAVSLRTSRVVALVPAHDEQDGIVQTVRSLQGQTRRPDRIIVVADNCTDATAALARSAGAEVVETVGNKHKKAGALNFALRSVLPGLQRGDVVLSMDADSQLMPDFIDTGLRYLAFSPRRGAVSGSYRARDDASVIGLLQRVEYAQGLHTVHSHGGRIHVLSGAACMFTVEALLAVAELRGSPALPGPRGWIYHQESLTEDYELTVALKRIGYEPLNARDCTVVTDVMTTWGAWITQRLRWQRGTLDTLSMYGWVQHTRKAWAIQVWTYLRSVIPLVMVLFWAYALTFESVAFQLTWLALLPVFVLDQVVSTWKAGGRARLFAALLLPLWIYDSVQLWVYWRALVRHLRSTESIWIV